MYTGSSLSYGFAENARAEAKREFFRYNLALYYALTSWCNESLGQVFEEDFENISLEYVKVMDALQRSNMLNRLQYFGVYLPTDNTTWFAIEIHIPHSDLISWTSGKPPSSIFHQKPQHRSQPEKENSGYPNEKDEDNQHQIRSMIVSK